MGISEVESYHYNCPRKMSFSFLVVVVVISGVVGVETYLYCCSVMKYWRTMLLLLDPGGADGRRIVTMIISYHYDDYCFDVIAMRRHCDWM